VPLSAGSSGATCCTPGAPHALATHCYIISGRRHSTAAACPGDCGHNCSSARPAAAQVRTHLLDDPKKASLTLQVTVKAIHDESALILALCSPADARAHALWRHHAAALAGTTPSAKATARAVRAAVLAQLLHAVAAHGLGAASFAPLRAYAVLLATDAGKPTKQESRVRTVQTRRKPSTLSPEHN
jgi:hypothetical protein